MATDKNHLESFLKNTDFWVPTIEIFYLLGLQLDKISVFPFKHSFKQVTLIRRQDQEPLFCALSIISTYLGG